MTLRGNRASDFLAQSSRNKRSVWTVTTQPYPEAHFATFPEALIEPCILAGSKPGDLVLDPFTGSGTTGAVAVRHQRDFVGCELNPAYVELARKRIGAVAPLFTEEKTVLARDEKLA
jgi:DNA modification methylase